MILVFLLYEIHPALRIIASDKNIIKNIQVILFSEASALLALLNMELPLAAYSSHSITFGTMK
tara:strand:- start:145 stop:333 length:189 start_codon:yes stop_codon:yes gene_type:complete